MATPQPSGAVSSSLITGPAPNGAVLMCTLKRFAEGRSAPPKKPTKTGTDEAQVPAPNQIPCPGMPEASVLHDIRVGSSFPRYEKFSYLESQLNFKKIHAHLLQQERHSSFPACSHAWTKKCCVTAPAPVTTHTRRQKVRSLSILYSGSLILYPRFL